MYSTVETPGELNIAFGRLKRLPLSQCNNMFHFLRPEIDLLEIPFLVSLLRLRGHSADLSFLTLKASQGH